MKIAQHHLGSQWVRLTLVGLVLSPVALLAQATDPAPSQDAPPPHARGQHMDPAQRQTRMLDTMTRRLNLSPDQVSQIKGIQADGETQMQALHADNSVQGPDRRAKMMDLHKSQNDKIRAVLNDEQKTKFDAMEAKHRGRMHGGDGEQGPPPPPPPAQ